MERQGHQENECANDFDPQPIESYPCISALVCTERRDYEELGCEQPVELLRLELRKAL